MHADGTFVGRAAPEIDFFEAQVDKETGGEVSQSAQWAVSSFMHILGPIHSWNSSHLMPNTNGSIKPMPVWPFSICNTCYKPTTMSLVIPDPTISKLNNYKGGAFQQATSVVTQTSKRHTHTLPCR
jgi:hypothetical protein